MLGVNIGNVYAHWEKQNDIVLPMYHYGRLTGLMAAPWHALVIAGVLSGYYALIRLILGRMYARFFEFQGIGTTSYGSAFAIRTSHAGMERTVTAPIRLDCSRGQLS